MFKPMRLQWVEYDASTRQYEATLCDSKATVRIKARRLVDVEMRCREWIRLDDVAFGMIRSLGEHCMALNAPSARADASGLHLKQGHRVSPIRLVEPVAA